MKSKNGDDINITGKYVSIIGDPVDPYNKKVEEYITREGGIPIFGYRIDNHRHVQEIYFIIGNGNESGGDGMFRSEFVSKLGSLGIIELELPVPYRMVPYKPNIFGVRMQCAGLCSLYQKKKSWLSRLFG